MLNIVIITWYNQNFIEVHRLGDFIEVTALGELSYIKSDDRVHTTDPIAIEL